LSAPKLFLPITKYLLPVAESFLKTAKNIPYIPKSFCAFPKSFPVPRNLEKKEKGLRGDYFQGFAKTFPQARQKFLRAYKNFLGVPLKFFPAPRNS